MAQASARGHRRPRRDGCAALGDQLRRDITAAEHLQIDDTSLTILGDDGGRVQRRRWTCLDPLARQAMFDATLTHARDGPAEFLADFQSRHGTLMSLTGCPSTERIRE
jgi:hypothetical protein